MKKLFVIALAAVGMVACVNDEIVETPQGNAISFDNAFIDNATRAELTAANLDAFNVWGYIDAENGQVAPLFEGTEVSKATGDWAYEDGARYWAPGMKHYFQAIAPLTTAVAAEHADGEVTAINYTVDGDSDLIYAAYDKVGAAAGSTNGPVSFTFGHLLSKVEFEFNNGFAAEDGVTIAVKNVKMTVPAKGKYDIATGEWAVDTTVAGKTLENIEGSKFVLPYDNSYAYAIEFDVDVTYGGVLINEDVHKTSSVMVALNKGTAYKFTATINAETLNMESIDFEVGTVDGWLTGDVNYREATFYVNNVTEFQKALNYAVGIENHATRAAVAKPVPTAIYFANDIVGDVTITEDDTNAPYHDIIIDGKGFKYDGQMSIYGGSVSGDGKLLIKNVNFETETADRDFIWCADSQNGSLWRYANNVTIDNCTFTANGAAVHTSVGARFQQCYNIKLSNCVATNLHSLLQAESCGSTVVVEKSQVVNGKNGVSFNNTMNAIISNTEIEAVGEGSYGIRHKGQQPNYALTVEGCTVNAFAPVLVRNMTANGYSLTFKGTNNFTSTNAFGIDVVISAADYDNDAALPAAPTGEYTITGDVDAMKVFPEDVLMKDAAALQEAINAGGTVVLGDDVVLPQGLVITNNATIDLNGHNIDITAAYDADNYEASSAIVNNATLTLTGNGTIKATNNYTVRNNGTMIIDGVTIENGIMNFNDLTIESGNISNSRTGKHAIYGNSAKLTINGGTFYNGNPGNATIFSYAGEVVIKDGEFSIADGTATLGWTSCLLDAQGNAKYDLYDGTFNGEIRDYNNNTKVYGGTYTHNSVNNFVADGFHAVQKDGKYVVLPEGVDAVAGTTAELNSAIANGENVMLEADITTGTDFNAETTSIDLNGNTLTMTSSDQKVKGDLTVKNGDVNVSKGYFDVRPTDATSTHLFEGVVFGNTEKQKTYGTSTNHVVSAIEFCPQASGDSAEFVFKKCTFNNAKVVFEGMSGVPANATVVFEECTFNNLGNTEAIDVANYLTIDITVKDCNFNIIATSNVSVVDAMPSSTVTVNFEGNNTVYGEAAVPTDSSLAGTVDEIRVFSSTSVKVKGISVDTVNGLDNVTCTGIATK